MHVIIGKMIRKISPWDLNGKVGSVGRPFLLMSPPCSVYVPTLFIYDLYETMNISCWLGKRMMS